jgi:hypothetical protein
LLGFVVFGALAFNLLLSVQLRHQRRPQSWAIFALLCIIATQIVFWLFTYPTNQATANWTIVPENWRELRAQWEYSHAAAALLNLVAMGSLVLSLLSWRGGSAGATTP